MARRGRHAALLEVLRRTGDRPPDPPVSLPQEVLGSVSPGKAPGPDVVPPALLRLSGAAEVRLLHEAFLARRDAREPAEDAESSWSEARVACLPKPGKNHERMGGWRPITLASALAKAYEAWLWRQLSAVLPPLPPAVVGFAPGGQPVTVVYCIATLFRRAVESHLPLACVSLDVEAAFDNLGPVRLDE